jgi:hypothetical protein
VPYIYNVYQAETRATVGDQANDVTVDNLGNAYVTSDARISMVSPAGVVTDIVGDGTLGHADGVGLSAKLNYATGIYVDHAGNLFFTERHYVRTATFSSDGVYTVSTIAGDGSPGSTDGTGTAARFNSPQGVLLDGTGAVLFVVDTGNHMVRRVTMAGEVTRLVGNGLSGALDGVGTAATFSSPYHLVIDSAGDGYITDRGNNKIRKIEKITNSPPFSSTAIITSTFAGSGNTGLVDDTGTAASFSRPVAIALDRVTGDIYVGDDTDLRLRKITPAGTPCQPL